MDESSRASHKEVTTQTEKLFTTERRAAHDLRTNRGTARRRETTRSAGAKRDAQQASASGPKTDTLSILCDSQKHTTQMSADHNACLKHSNFLKQH